MSGSFAFYAVLLLLTNEITYMLHGVIRLTSCYAVVSVLVIPSIDSSIDSYQVEAGKYNRFTISLILADQCV